MKALKQKYRNAIRSASSKRGDRRNTMRRFPLFAFQILLFAHLAQIGTVAPPALFAQEAEAPEGVSLPEETEILLPPEFFQFRSVDSDEIEALLPELPPIEPARVTVPLPEPEGGGQGLAATVRIPEPEEAFQEESAPGGSSIFTTGSLGAGSVNYILGELALFKIGEDPRFRFEFLHRGLDGFAFNDPGTGYFLRVDRLAGWIAAEGEDGRSIESSAAYSEREIGFQGRPNYYSAEFRRIEGELIGHYPLADRVGVYLDARGGYANRLYTVKVPTLDPPQVGESVVRPRIGLEMDFNRFRLDLYGRFGFRVIEGAPVSSAQEIAGGVEAGYELGDHWYAEAGTELLRELNRGFLFPFSATLGYDTQDQFSIEFSGGMEYLVPTLTELWYDYPLLAPGNLTEEELPSQEAWYGAGALGWRPAFTGLEFELTGRYEERHRGLSIEQYSDVGDFLPFETELRRRLTTGVRTIWQPNQRVELAAGWRGNFFDRHFLEVGQEATAEADYQLPGRNWGLRSDVSVPVYDDILLPVWNLEAYARPIEAVEVRLGVDDLLSPLLGDGRGYGANEPSEEYPFVKPGFTVRLETRITL